MSSSLSTGKIFHISADTTEVSNLLQLLSKGSKNERPSEEISQFQRQLFVAQVFTPYGRSMAQLARQDEAKQVREAIISEGAIRQNKEFVDQVAKECGLEVIEY